eukprot:1143406-Pelagomonas_calceolata.AAC.7
MYTWTCALACKRVNKQKAYILENDKFAKAFKDPKFIELFSEYAKEVSDPKMAKKAQASSLSRDICIIVVVSCPCLVHPCLSRFAQESVSSVHLLRSLTQVKEETDLYLRQLEAEGRGEEVYGKDVTLIVPEAGFVVKTVEPSSGKRAYINLCTSSKVGVAGSAMLTCPGGLLQEAKALVMRIVVLHVLQGTS